MSDHDEIIGLIHEYASLLDAGELDGVAALFAHAHILRILTARWLGLEPAAGRLFAMDTATIGTLGYEHETRVITRWNLSVSESPG